MPNPRNSPPMLSKLHWVLDLPVAYRTFSRSLRKTNTVDRLVNDVLRIAPEMAVLDIGCGQGDILNSLPRPVHYHGIDIHEPSIATAKLRFGESGQFRVGDASTAEVFAGLGQFDRIFTLGVVHHLNDAQASTMLSAARSHLAPGGRFVAFENVLIPRQNPIAKWIIRNDRGEFVRTEHGYASLLARHFPSVRITIVHDMLRIPYTHIALDCGAD